MKNQTKHRSKLPIVLVVCLLFTLLANPAFAANSESYIETRIFNGCTGISDTAFDLMAHGSISSAWKKGKVWYTFTKGGKTLYVEPSCFSIGGGNAGVDMNVTNAITNGLNGGSSFITINRCYFRKNNLSLAKYAIYSGGSTPSYNVQCTMTDAVSFHYNGMTPINNWLTYKINKNAVSTSLNRAKGLKYGRSPTFYIKSKEGKLRDYKYKVYNKKKVRNEEKTCKVHNGDFSYYSIEAKGYAPNKSYSLTDYAKVGVETVGTVKSLATNIATGNLLGIAQIGVKQYQQLTKQGASSNYKTNGVQYLSTDLKRVYVLQMTSPVQMKNNGDYVSVSFNVVKPAKSYYAYLKI